MSRARSTARPCLSGPGCIARSCTPQSVISCRLGSKLLASRCASSVVAISISISCSLFAELADDPPGLDQRDPAVHVAKIVVWVKRIGAVGFELEPVPGHERVAHRQYLPCGL